MYKGRRLSILGDSISTYLGVSNDETVNSTVKYNHCFYGKRNFSVEETYWGRLIEKFGFDLCVNNSWSGGNLSGRLDETSGVNRASELARDSGETPDVIIVFMGINDFGRGVTPEVFSMDYEETLMTINENYPDAVVCCVNLPNRTFVFEEETKVYNNVIETAVMSMGERYVVADLFGSRMSWRFNDGYYNNTLDGLHPDQDGMRMIAEVIESTLNSTPAFLKLAREIDK